MRNDSSLGVLKEHTNEPKKNKLSIIYILFIYKQKYTNCARPINPLQCQCFGLSREIQFNVHCFRSGKWLNSIA